MSFTIKASGHGRNSGSRHISVQYNDDMSSLNNPTGSLIDLGWIRHGTALFALAGPGTQEDPFVSSNPPIAWMQSTLTSIGSRSLREIALPASHDSGMSELTGANSGLEHNTLTQTYNVFQQLVFGVRVFDIRPVRYEGSFWTGHFSQGPFRPIGSYGRSLNKIVADINSFNEKYPGELIILNISHEMNRDRGYLPFNNDDWQALYQILNQIKDLWTSSSTDFPYDLSTVPLSSFITPDSSSSVLIRFPDGFPLPNTDFNKRRQALQVTVTRAETTTTTGKCDTADNTLLDRALLSSDPIDWLPPPTTPIIALSAFLPSSRLPQTGSYSNTEDPSYLTTDQLSKLRAARPSPTAQSHASIWTITQKAGKVINVWHAPHSIIRLSTLR